MRVKAQLVADISDLIRKRALTQTRAAETLGLTQPKVSALLKGQFRGISEHRLLECLMRLGRDVQIVVKHLPRGRETGRLTLIMPSPVSTPAHKKREWPVGRSLLPSSEA